MSLHRRSPPRRWRLEAAAPLIAAASLAACESQAPAPPAAPVEENAVQPAPPAPPPIVPAPLPPLDRAGLLGLADRAADAVAAGAPPPAADKRFVGRPFEIRLPFGCAGEADQPDRWATATVDAKRGTLKLTARPTLSQEDPILAGTADAGSFDRAEGFWIERHWTRSEACPPGPPAPPAPPDQGAPPPAVGIVQLFAPDAPRTRQRDGRPYMITRKLDPAEPVEGGFHLVLSGRIAGFADGYPVHCRLEGAMRRPPCVIAAEFSRVAFERTRDGSVLAEWPR